MRSAFCDDPMDSDYQVGRLHNYGWQSHKTLADKGLLQRLVADPEWAERPLVCHCRQGASHTKHDFIRAMIEWGDGAGGQRDDFSRREEGRAAADAMSHGGGHFPIFDDDHDDDLGLTRGGTRSDVSNGEFQQVECPP